MIKNAKKKVMLAALLALALGNTMSAAAAANSSPYAAFVSKVSDYTTISTLYKTTHGNATNQVDSISQGTDLCSWILNHAGMRVTNKKSYDGVGKYYMTFEVATDVENPGPHLATTMVISTQLLEFSSSNSTGTWSPDPF